MSGSYLIDLVNSLEERGTDLVLANFRSVLGHAGYDFKTFPIFDSAFIECKGDYSMHLTHDAKDLDSKYPVGALLTKAYFLIET